MKFSLGLASQQGAVCTVTIEGKEKQSEVGEELILGTSFFYWQLEVQLICLFYYTSAIISTESMKLVDLVVQVQLI